jgi:hypothetical protein
MRSSAHGFGSRASQLSCNLLSAAYRNFAEVLDAVSARGTVAAVTSADKAQAVLQSHPNFWTVNNVL